MKVRKKPVEVDAWLIPAPDAPDDMLPAWVVDAVIGKRITVDAAGGLVVHTLEGDMVAAAGDWLIRGLAGELYPCKPDIFARSYEPIEDGTQH